MLSSYPGFHYKVRGNKLGASETDRRKRRSRGHPTRFRRRLPSELDSAHAPRKLQAQINTQTLIILVHFITHGIILVVVTFSLHRLQYQISKRRKSDLIVSNSIQYQLSDFYNGVFRVPLRLSPLECSE